MSLFTVISAAAMSASFAAALVAGVFLTFSDFVMRSLAVSAPKSGAEAMQNINREVYRSVFMVLLMGLVPVSAGFLVIAGLGLTGPATPWLVAGSLTYLAGTFLVTAIGNVPMNQRLDRLALADGAAQDYWPDYERRWTRLNHVRTLASGFAAALFLGGAMALAGA